MMNKIDDVKAIMVCAKIREELVELIGKYAGQLNTDCVRQCIQADIKQYFDKFSCSGYELVDKNGQPLRPEHFINKRGEFCIPQDVLIRQERL